MIKSMRSTVLKSIIANTSLNNEEHKRKMLGQMGKKS